MLWESPLSIQVLALVSAALIEMARYRVVREAGVVERFLAAGPDANPLDPQFRHPMRYILWNADLMLYLTMCGNAPGSCGTLLFKKLEA